MRTHYRLTAGSAVAMLLTVTACSDRPSTASSSNPVIATTTLTVHTQSGDRSYIVSRDGRRSADGRWRGEGDPLIRIAERAPLATAPVVARGPGLAELRRVERSVRVTRIRDGQTWRRLAVIPEPASGLPRTVYHYEDDRPLLRQEFTYRKGGRRAELATVRTTIYGSDGAPIATADRAAQTAGFSAGRESLPGLPARLLAACRALGPSTAWAQDTDESFEETTIEETAPCWGELRDYLKKGLVLAITTTALQILIADCIVDPTRAGCSAILPAIASWIKVVDEAAVALEVYLDCRRSVDASVALMDPLFLHQRSVA